MRVLVRILKLLVMYTVCIGIVIMPCQAEQVLTNNTDTLRASDEVSVEIAFEMDHVLDALLSDESELEWDCSALNEEPGSLNLHDSLHIKAPSKWLVMTATAFSHCYGVYANLKTKIFRANQRVKCTLIRVFTFFKKKNQKSKSVYRLLYEKF